MDYQAGGRCRRLLYGILIWMVAVLMFEPSALGASDHLKKQADSEAASKIENYVRPNVGGLVLDRSGSMSGMMEEVYRAAFHAIEAGTPEDETFVVTVNGDVELTQDFTSDRRKLQNENGPHEDEGS